jgi:hypothetical protein
VPSAYPRAPRTASSSARNTGSKRSFHATARSQEQLWTNYYVDRGSVGPEVKLVNDAVTGWNDEQFVEFRAPKDPGKVTIWAVVHDNRGGSNFVRFTFGVQ